MAKREVELDERKIRIKKLMENITIILAAALISSSVLYVSGVVHSGWLLWSILGMGAAMNLLITIIGIMSEIWIVSAAAFLLALWSAGGLYYFR